jgi:NAD(P)-dependent dehydrogenase (short-subunit alcohol dehydrogenase family)
LSKSFDCIPAHFLLKYSHYHDANWVVVQKLTGSAGMVYTYSGPSAKRMGVMTILTGQIALVTGSARRVGKSIALELARQGMDLVVHHSGRSTTEAEETAREIRAFGRRAIIVPADQSEPEQVNALFAAIRQEYGHLDLLVNSAAIFRRGNILDVTPQEWRQVIDTNLTGPFLCSQAAARLMRETGRPGVIINISDLSAYHPWKAFPTDSVSKAGLNMLTEVLALSLAPDIRVNGVALGPILRDVGNPPDVWQKIGERLPVGHTGDPQDVAQAVVFLATQPFITGTTLRVDGGESLL